ncbi:MAG: T9SS type A sorting domain-containing protein [Crocinitomicaceae bacterium]
MKKIYILLGALVASGAAMAQAPYANGQYEFSSTVKHAPNGITFTDMRDVVQNQDRAVYYTEDFDAGFGTWTAAIQNGGVGFEITNTGHANDAGSSFTIPSLQSTTPTNWVLLDSDSDGTSGSDEDATLTSATIDVSSAGTLPLKLEFEQFFAEWENGSNFDTLFIGISDDAGATWDEVIISDGVGREGRPNPELVSLNISPYVTDYTQVQIRFRWRGNWAYGWQFDNVCIAELPQNDMTVQTVFRGDLVNSIMYSKVPDEQATEFVIGADVKNIGFLDQTNIVIDWEIFDPSMNSLGTGTSANSIASLSNGQNDTIWTNTGITPVDLGVYTVSITVNAAETDDATGNDNMEDMNFELTDYEYAADYGAPQSAFYNWANNNDGAASIGNIFLIQTDGVIGGMKAQLDDNAIVADKLIYYAIYKSDGTQYVYEDQTSDYTTESGDEGTFVTIFFDNPINVIAGDQIMAVAVHYGGTETAGWDMAGRVSQGSVVGTDETQATVSLIDPSAPMVRMLMTDYTGLEAEGTTDKFSVYPNPANEQINVAISLTNSENTVINVVDISGKVIKTMNLGNVQGDKNLTISLDNMTTGVYFIEMVNEAGKQVKKFVKK